MCVCVYIVYILYILFLYIHTHIYFTTEEKFICEISVFVVDAIVAHIPRQQTLDFRKKQKKNCN